jgi:asparagine synthase (glutamine-hydrolysing)
MGFGVPIENWFRGSLDQYIRTILLSERSLKRGLFKRESVENILTNHQRTKVNFANQIWALLTLELWFREYFD